MSISLTFSHFFLFETKLGMTWWTLKSVLWCIEIAHFVCTRFCLPNEDVLVFGCLSFNLRYGYMGTALSLSLLLLLTRISKHSNVGPKKMVCLGIWIPYVKIRGQKNTFLESLQESGRKRRFSSFLSSTCQLSLLSLVFGDNFWYLVPENFCNMLGSWKVLN